MRLNANAIVTNQFNQVLFIRRNDSRTWAPPGGALDAGELPTDAMRREVEEETGLKTMPVRLVGLYYRPEKPDGILIFVFRAIQRGGQLQTSPESPQVGFIDTVSVPWPMLGVHREMLDRALAHDGGPPYWGYQPMPLGVRLIRDVVYGSYDLWRALRGQPASGQPSQWSVGAFTIVVDEEGDVLWVKRRDYDVWNLPGGRRQGMEAPWETAVRETREETGLDVKLLHLSGVYVKPQANEVIFSFLARAGNGQLKKNQEATDFAYFAPGDEPPNTLPKHVERVADAAGPQKTTLFREQSGPPGLQLLREAGHIADQEETSAR